MPGRHLVAVTKATYLRFERSIEVAAGETVSIDVGLQAAGRVKVTTDPANATVFVDGIPRAAPHDFDIGVGKHTLRVEAVGYRAWDMTFEVTHGDLETLRIALEPVRHP